MYKTNYFGKYSFAFQSNIDKKSPLIEDLKPREDIVPIQYKIAELTFRCI